MTQMWGATGFPEGLVVLFVLYNPMMIRSLSQDMDGHGDFERDRLLLEWRTVEVLQ